MKSNKKKSKNKSLLILLVAIAAVYLVFSFYFMSHFFFGTKINAIDAAGKSVSDVENAFRDEASGYVLTITGRDNKTGALNASDIALSLVFDDEIDEFLDDQNPFAWPKSLFKTTTLSTNSIAEFDTAALENAVDKLDFFNGERLPQNASISDYTDGGYSVLPEDQGSKLDKNKVYEVVENAVGSLLETIDLDSNDCYIKPEITSDDAELNEKVNNLNKYVTTKVTYTFGDETETLDGSTIKDWLTIEGTSVSLNRADVKEYVDGLARRHDTFGKNRTFKTTAGKTVSVNGGNYGWWTDRPSTTDALVEAISSGKQGEMTPVYFSTAAKYGENDIGDTYVECDLDNQHVYVYVSGNLVVETDCVSGKAVEGRYTPDGTYAITYKERDATLVGENYESAVSYWMPFNGNIGLHDATWRNKFGGDIYLSNGSHGCINLPKSKAKEIYDCVSKGEPVVVYGGVVRATPKAPELTEEQKQQLLLQQLLEQMAAGNIPAAATQQPATDGAAAEAAPAPAVQ